jgi:hypothetical protein
MAAKTIKGQTRKSLTGDGRGTLKTSTRRALGVKKR